MNKATGTRTWRDSRLTLVLVAVVACAVVALVLFDWNWLRGPMASRLSAEFGRPVRIDGDLRGEFSLKPMFTADSVVVDNVLPGSEREMARAQRVSARIDLLSLFHGSWSLPELVLAAPDILLERDAAGRDNWTFPPGSDFPRIGSLEIRDGVIRFRDPTAKTDVTAELTASPTTDSASLPVRFKGGGTVHGQPFTLDGTAATLLALENENEPYRIETRGRAGSTSFRFDGKFIPARPDNVDGTLLLEGRDLSQLYPIVPVPFPWTPPYRLNGRLRHEGKLWSFQDIAGKIGNSDVTGQFSYEGKEARPYVVADIVSKRLDYKDLGGLVGLPPASESSGSRTSEQSREAVKLETSGRVLPSKPFDLSHMRTVDATVHLRGTRFKTSALPLDDLDARLDLRDGVMKLAPLDFGVGGGKVSSTMTIDARKQVMATVGDVTVRNVEVGLILPELKPPSGSAGKLGGRAQFTARGNSMAQMLATANGEVALISSGGNASELAIVMTNLDLARAAQLLLSGDAKSPIRCLVADVVAEDGLMSVKTLVADTTAEKIIGGGVMDFRNEGYDLALKAESKKPSLIALRGPIKVEGTFKSPRVGPAVGPLAARVSAAVALGTVLTPIAALLPLIDFGGASDADCRALMTDAQVNVDSRADTAASPRKK